jgi:hypothetical protein
MVTTGLRGLLVAGGCHNPQSSASAELLGPRPKRSATSGSLQCNRLWSYTRCGGAKPVLKNVMQIARKPCHGMGTGVVSLLQGFCRV